MLGVVTMMILHGVKWGVIFLIWSSTFNQKFNFKQFFSPQNQTEIDFPMCNMYLLHENFNAVVMT